MNILKRVTMWLAERAVEGFLLGSVFLYLSLQNGGHSSAPIRNDAKLGTDLLFATEIVVGMLFIFGYYYTTAFFGVIWRSGRLWLYPTITAILLVIHAHAVFAIVGSGFTPQAKARELPFVVVGALIAFFCSAAGNFALSKWTSGDRGTNAFLSAASLTLVIFFLANTANFMRPVVGDLAFREYGIPFTFYREGGYVSEWVWREGVFLWRGVIADAAVVAGIILLLGTGWRKFSSAKQLK